MSEKRKKVQSIILRFVKIQHSYFSTATRLSGGLIAHHEQNPEVGDGLLAGLLNSIGVGVGLRTNSFSEHSESSQGPSTGRADGSTGRTGAPDTAQPEVVTDLFPDLTEYHKPQKANTPEPAQPSRPGPPDRPDLCSPQQQLEDFTRNVQNDRAQRLLQQRILEEERMLREMKREEAELARHEQREREAWESEMAQRDSTSSFDQLGKEFTSWVKDFITGSKKEEDKSYFDLPVPDSSKPSEQPSCVEERRPRGNAEPEEDTSIKQLYIDQLYLEPPSPQLEVGGGSVTCRFRINTPVFGDALIVDCLSQFIELQTSPITIAPGSTFSEPFDLKAVSHAPSGWIELPVLLSGNNVQNLKRFEFKIPVEIVPRADQESPDKFASIIDDKPAEKKVVKVPRKIRPAQPPKPEPIIPEPAGGLDLFGEFDRPAPKPPKSKAEEKPDVSNFLDDLCFSPTQVRAPANPLDLFNDPQPQAAPASDPDDLMASLFSKKEEKPELRKFENGEIASTGEGFREDDISDIFDRYALSSNPDLIDVTGFQQAWSHLCLPEPWNEHFLGMSDSERTHVRKQDFCRKIHEYFRKAAEASVEKELDAWEFTVRPARKPLITLMSSMKKVLTYDTSYWKAPTIASLMQPRQVRKSYLKTMRIVHPDRTRKLIYPDRARAERVYRALTEEYQKYATENQV